MKARQKERFARILSAAAVVILIVLAYFIPVCAERIQDLTYGSRTGRHEVRAVSFASGSAGFFARLQGMQMAEDYGYILVDGGKNIPDAPSAIHTALQELSRLNELMGEERFPVEESLFTDSAEAEAFLVSTPGTADTFMIWSISLTTEGQYIGGVAIDDATGKILSLDLSFAGESWQESPETAILEKGAKDSSEAAIQEKPAYPFEEYADAWILQMANVMAPYYGMTLQGIDFLESENHAAYAIYESSAGTVILPVVCFDTSLAFNESYLSYSLELMYGTSARDLVEALR